MAIKGKDLILIAKKISKHKSLEIQLTLWESASFYLFNNELSWSKRGDHAGITMKLEIGRLFFSFQIYDCRHWDWENDCYQKE